MYISGRAGDSTPGGDAASRGADGPAATGFVLGLAARVIGKNKWLLWVQQDFLALECGDIPGTGLFAFGIDPSLLIMVKVPNPAAALRAFASFAALRGWSWK